MFAIASAIFMVDFICLLFRIRTINHELDTVIISL